MSNKEKNLKLWEAVGKTDPKFTKGAKKGAYTFTSIAPVYQFKMATEQFGPQGLGWGVVIGSEVFTEREYGTTIILSYDATMFFILDGARGEIPIHASEKSCYKTQGSNGYMKIDDEARKKVVTNAKTKGLSELGFNSDVFMGQFDNSEYLNEVREEFRKEEGQKKIDDEQERRDEYEKWFNQHCDKIADSVDRFKLKNNHVAAVRSANLSNDTVAVQKFTTIKDRRKLELENAE